MNLFDKMRQKKLFSTTLMLFTLSVGILIGTLVNTQVNAAKGQKRRSGRDSAGGSQGCRNRQ